MAELLNSSAYWAWLASILAVAGLAVSIIVLVTRSNMAAMAHAVGDALARTESAARRGSHVNAPSFVTAATARMRVDDDTFIIRVERTFHGDEALALARDGISDLVSGLLDHGTEPEDILSEEIDVAGEAPVATCSILVRGSDRARVVVAESLKSGFREGRGAKRQVFSIEDAHEVLGRRVLERSRLNAEILSGTLKLGSGFQLVGAELSTEAEAEDAGERVVTMRARSTWSVALSDAA